MINLDNFATIPSLHVFRRRPKPKGPYRNIKDRFPSKADLNSYTPLDFISGLIRQPLPHRPEDEETIAANNNFDLHFRIPKNFSKNDDKHLLVMLNGFDEEPPHLNFYSFHQKSISERIFDTQEAGSGSLSESSLATVILPVPFHHWRRPVEGEYIYFDSSKMILHDPIRLYLGFQQLLYDFLRLCEQVQNPATDDGYESVFTTPPKIHLLGYSLGGLAALSAFLLDRCKEGKDLIESCTLVASGVNLKIANLYFGDVPADTAGKIRQFYEIPYRDTGSEPEYEKDYAFFDLPPEERWISMKRKLSKNGKEKYGAIIEILFERVILGYSIQDSQLARNVDEVWYNSCSNISTVNAQNDEVMPSNFQQKCTPNNGNYTQLYQLSNSKHSIHISKDWLGDGGDKLIHLLVEKILSAP